MKRRSAVSKAPAKPKSSFIADHYAVIFLAIAIAFAIFKVEMDKARAAETFLASLLLFNVGLQGIFAGFAHWYRPVADKIAMKIGWLPGSPFQKEVAAADAAFGVLGVLSFFLRGDFMAATAIGASIMFFFMGIGHILDIVRNRNKSVYNAGSVVYFDILLPIVMLALLALSKIGY